MISALCCWFLHCRYGDLVLQELRFASPQPGQDPLAFKRWLIKVFLHSEAPLTAWNAEEDSWARTCGILSNKIQNLEEAECVSCNRACWVVAGFQGCFENIRQSVEHFIMIFYDLLFNEFLGHDFWTSAGIRNVGVHRGLLQPQL